MSTSDQRGVPAERLRTVLAAEQALYAQRNPRSAALAAEGSRHWLRGVPMHWMVDWPTPFPLAIQDAQGVTLTDVDGNRYADFCLGDTGAMFGHAPPAIVKALQAQAARGLTTMLPSEDTAIVGRLLAQHFGLPLWQVTVSASDANRAVIRWARAATGRDKLLVVNGCYHGAVDDTFVALENGKARYRPGLVGEVRDVTATTRVVEFNDLAALEQALAHGDVGLVLLEPVMTNCGMVLPDEGYHAALRALTRKHGTLLAIDETHTISSGPRGYTGTHALDPDFFILGKPIAGGVPAAVYGMTAEVETLVQKGLADREPGYSGIGTTLSGSALQLALMRVVLESILTDETYARAMPLAAALESGIARLIVHHDLPWHVVRVGLRVEFVCSPDRPRNGTEAGLVAHNEIEHTLHLFALNRGVVVTPFHNMLLICPATTASDIDRLIAVLDEGMAALTGRPRLT